MLTNADIQNLIKEPKIIVEPFKSELKLDKMHFRNDFKLVSKYGKNKFSVFLRKHKDFSENFSIGLIYHSEDGTNYTLFRCNGNHGEVVIDILKPIPHFGYHIHRLTEELIQKNCNEPKLIEMTNEYASFEQALKYFCEYTNITNASDYFTDLYQLELPFDKS